MNHLYLIEDLGLMLVAATCMLLATSRLEIPPIVNYLIAGLLIGPILGWIEQTSHLTLLSNTGIVLLLFLVGIELNIHQFKLAGRHVLLVASIQMSCTCLAIYLLARVLGESQASSFLLGLICMFSSTVVVVKLLHARKEMRSFHGRIAIGILLLQDMVALAALTFVTHWEGTHGETATDPFLALSSSMAGMTALLTLAWLSSKYLTTRALNWALPIPGMMFIWSLGWCFMFVSLAHAVGLSHEIGAFLAGLSLAQSSHSQELKRRVHPLMNFFVVVFFVMLGAETQIKLSMLMWLKVLLLSATVMAVKLAGVALPLMRMGRRHKESFRAGIHLAQISEFSFILAALATQKGLISAETQTVIAWTGILTITLSAFSIRSGESMIAWFAKSRFPALETWGSNQTSEPASPLESSQQPILVIGMNALGRNIVQRLIACGETITAIDSDPEKLKSLPCQSYHGNIHDWDLLESAGFHEAKLIVSALQNEEANQLLAFRAKGANIPCCVMAPDTLVMPALLDLNISYFMTPFADGIKRQHKELIQSRLLKR
jgi:Kef-type K+ transport system membrane component KefB